MAQNNYYKKDYLTSQEQLQVMLLLCLKSTTQTMIEDWGKRKVLSTEEMKNLKTSKTYLTKFLEGYLNRLNQKELVKLDRKMKINTVRLYDKFQLESLNRKIDEAYSKTVLDSDEFCLFCENIMDVKCKDCTKHWEECELYNLFDKNLAPESGHALCNCKYAYTK